MPIKVHEGQLQGERFRFGLVVSKFNREVCEVLLNSAVATLKKHGVKEKDIVIVRVPGAFEIPLLAKRLAESMAFQAVICLGAVVRGQTPHFDMITREMSRGISRVMMLTGIPISFGILATETIEQAVERADPERYDRGGDAALTAIEMASLLRELK